MKMFAFCRTYWLFGIRALGIYTQSLRPCSRSEETYVLHMINTKLFKRSVWKNQAFNSKQFSRLAVSSAKKLWIEKFTECNVPEPETSIDLLLSTVLGLKNISSLNRMGKRILSLNEHARLQEMAALRLKRMPVQYIIGEWDFCNLTLKMCRSPSVFIPRPETEELVNIVLELLTLSEQDENKPLYEPSCLEVGCGSGAVSLGLLSRHSKLRCTAVDANPTAVNLTKDNAEILGFANRISAVHAIVKNKFQQTDVPVLAPRERFDILVSNPPYIPTSEIRSLSAEVFEYEDHFALDGGSDGTVVIQAILEQAPSMWLKKDSFIVLEVDPRQTEKIQMISQRNGSYVGDVIDVRKDCFGVERFVVLRCK